MQEQTFKNLLQYMEELANPQLIPQMESYMKHRFSFLGINGPLRKSIAAEFFKGKKWTRESLLDFVKSCWDGKYRELQYLAIDLLTKYKKLLTLEDMDFIEMLVVSKSWWDSVDGLAANIMGHLLKQDMELRMQYLERWCQGDNIWLKRTAILHQLKYKKDVDTEILEYTIDCSNGTKEFFLNKAIGWMLREYSKTNPDYVLTYVESNELHSLSKKEALKHLSRGN